MITRGNMLKYEKNKNKNENITKNEEIDEK